MKCTIFLFNITAYRLNFSKKIFNIKALILEELYLLYNQAVKTSSLNETNFVYDVSVLDLATKNWKKLVSNHLIQQAKNLCQAHACTFLNFHLYQKAIDLWVCPNIIQHRFHQDHLNTMLQKRHDLQNR